VKLEINLDDITVGDWEETVGRIIKDEMEQAVRTEIRKQLRDRRGAMEKDVRSAMAKYMSHVPTADDLMRTAFKEVKHK
jgi:hypothetical protein